MEYIKGLPDCLSLSTRSSLINLRISTLCKLCRGLIFRGARKQPLVGVQCRADTGSKVSLDPHRVHKFNAKDCSLVGHNFWRGLSHLHQLKRGGIAQVTTHAGDTNHVLGAQPALTNGNGLAHFQRTINRVLKQARRQLA